MVVCGVGHVKTLVPIFQNPCFMESATARLAVRLSDVSGLGGLCFGHRFTLHVAHFHCTFGSTSTRFVEPATVHIAVYLSLCIYHCTVSDIQHACLVGYAWPTHVSCCPSSIYYTQTALYEVGDGALRGMFLRCQCMLRLDRAKKCRFNRRPRHSNEGSGSVTNNGEG